MPFSRMLLRSDSQHFTADSVPPRTLRIACVLVISMGAVISSYGQTSQPKNPVQPAHRGASVPSTQKAPASQPQNLSIHPDPRIRRFEAMQRRVARMTANDVGALEILASDAQPDALFMLGLYYVNANQKQDGESWWTEAAASHNVYALHALGTATERAPLARRKYLEQAAAENYPPSQYALGKLLLGAASKEEGSKLIINAAKGGLPDAQMEVGLCLLKKKCDLLNIVPSNDSGKNMLEAAAKNGNADAAEALAAMPASGNAAARAATTTAANLDDPPSVLRKLSPLSPPERVELLKKLIAEKPESANVAAAREEILWSVDGQGEKPTQAMLRGQNPDDVTVLYFELRSELDHVLAPDRKSVLITIDSENAAKQASGLATRIVPLLGSNLSLGLANGEALKARLAVVRENADFAVKIYPELSKQRRYHDPQTAADVVANYQEAIGGTIDASRINSYVKVMTTVTQGILHGVSKTVFYFDKTKGYKSLTYNEEGSLRSVVYKAGDQCLIVTAFEKKLTTQPMGGGCLGNAVGGGESNASSPEEERKTRFLGLVQLGDRKVWRIAYKQEDSDTTIDYDSETFLMIGSHLVSKKYGCSESVYGDYRQFGNWLMPAKHKMDFKCDSKDLELWDIERFDFNVPIVEPLTLTNNDVELLKKGAVFEQKKDDAEHGINNNGGFLKNFLIGLATVYAPNTPTPAQANLENMLQTSVTALTQSEQQSERLFQAGLAATSAQVQTSLSQRFSVADASQLGSLSDSHSRIAAPSQPAANQLVAGTEDRGCRLPDTWQEGEFELHSSGSLDLFIRSYLVADVVDKTGKHSSSGDLLRIINLHEKATASFVRKDEETEIKPKSEIKLPVPPVPAKMKFIFCGASAE